MEDKRWTTGEKGETCFKADRQP